MSCKIERLISGEEVVVLQVSGRLRAEHLHTLRDLLEREEGKIAIDLANVILIARDAVEFLALSEARGVELRNCSSYVREWISRERAHTGGRPTDLKTGARDDTDDV